MGMQTLIFRNPLSTANSSHFLRHCPHPISFRYSVAIEMLIQSPQLAILFGAEIKEYNPNEHKIMIPRLTWDSLF